MDDQLVHLLLSVYSLWREEQGLPDDTPDALLDRHQGLTSPQRAWLQAYCALWDANDAMNADAPAPPEPAREMPRAARLAKMLREAGYTILGEVIEPCDVADGFIKLSERVHVSVGFDYLHVVMELPNKALKFYPSRQRMTAILPDIVAAIRATSATH